MERNYGLSLIGSRLSEKKRQKGAVLLVSVVTLSLLALAGLSTVEQTVVQERGAINGQAADQASRNAEEGLKQAVKDLVSGDLFALDGCSLELEEDETQSDWECEVVSDGDGYTYVVSYVMNGDQPAQDEDGNTIYKISVNGVQGGGNSGSLASQKLTAGVSLSTTQSAGIWDAAIVGCRQVVFEDSVDVEGDVLSTNETAGIDLRDNGELTGDVFITDDYAKNGGFSLSGDATELSASACDPLVVSNFFAAPLASYDANDGSASDYSQPESGGKKSKLEDDTISASRSFKDFKFEDKKLELGGEIDLYIEEKFDLKNANVDVKNENDVINIYVGSPDGSDYDGEAKFEDVKFSVKGVVNLYVANDFEMKDTEINFQGTSPEFNIFVGSPDGSGFDGHIKIDGSYFTGGGGGRAAEEFITIYGLFGESDLDNVSDACSSSGNDTVLIKDTPNGKTFGGRVYAPRASICIDDAQFRGQVRGYDVVIKGDDTDFEYSVASELQSNDESSEVEDFTLFFFTKGDIDFVAGGEENCLATGDPEDSGSAGNTSSKAKTSSEGNTSSKAKTSSEEGSGSSGASGSSAESGSSGAPVSCEAVQTESSSSKSKSSESDSKAKSSSKSDGS